MEIKSFLGTGWAFPPSFSKERKTTQMSDNESDIRESLFILLSTIPGERVHRPNYGCGIYKMVFEKMNSSTETLLRHTIETSIIRFEPRISLNQVNFDFSNEKAGTLKIKIDYTIRLTNTRSNIVYPFYFKEGTNLR